jgi:Flp pilus assembly protein TadG
MRARFRTLPIQPSAPRRRGVAVVELAVCLPLMLMLTFGAIEAANAVFLKQSLVTAAYEAARAATATYGTEDDGKKKCDEVLKVRGVVNPAITFSPKITSATKAGTAITVTVTAPANSNSVGPQWYMKNSTIRAVIVMPRL